MLKHHRESTLLSILSIACLSIVTVLGIARGAAAQEVLVADAGQDLDLECMDETTDVTLDGTGSSMGPDITYLWEADGVTFDDPTTLTPTGAFPAGSTVVTLTVTQTDPDTAAETTASDTVDVVVGDTTPPVASAMPTPSMLWPPNHQLVPVAIQLDVSDACDAQPAIVLESITSSEPDNGIGDGNTTGDIQEATLETDDRAFLLRAERSGAGNGRVYEAVYRVTDGAGNQTVASALVTVAHDQSQAKQAEKADKKASKERWKTAMQDVKNECKAEMSAIKAAKKAEKQALKAN